MDVEREEKEIEEDHEEWGTGVNKDIYFVTDDILSNKWTLLPLITSEQLIQSRKLKYIFSGDLNKKIVSSP